MRETENFPKRPELRASVNRSSWLVACLALPLCCGLVACSGSNSDSKVSGSGSSGFNGIGAGGSGLNVPGGNSGGVSSGAGGSTSMTPGVYMLPADFTMADMGGYKLGAAIDPSSAGGVGGASGTAGSSSAGNSASSCGTQILGVVRDFKGNNEPSGHPDFEHFQGNGPSVGIVKGDLGDDQKPVYAADGPFIDPVNGQQTTSKVYFDEWYRATPGVNEPFIVYLYFQPNGAVLTFESTAFFPLDGAGWGNSPGQSHNFGFTTEVHTRFNYKGKETFKFTGDDDLWVFINHKLAIDLGGLHKEAELEISLDDKASDLGITTGNAYALDLFHAERHSVASDFRVDTNLEFTNCGTVVADPVPK